MFGFRRRSKGASGPWNVVGVIVAVLFVFLAAALAWMVRSPIPKVNGTVEVAGIEAPVTIRRDQRGMPHIEASSEQDLFFAQGFACAQDRLWQMDTLRRQAQGRLSEIAGPATLEVDRYMRRLGFREAAEADLQKLHGPARADLEAYAAGVNAAMATHPLSLEFQLMRYRPQAWTPVDSITVVKLMAQRLDDQWSKPKLLADLIERVGPTAARALTDSTIPKLEEYIPSSGAPPKKLAGARSRRPRQLADDFVSVAWARYRSPLPHDRGIGSNNWAVSGRLTTTGKPVLANDTHLAHSLPSTWWLSHLHGAGLNVEGFQIPGLPGMIIGHNEHIAFGVTSAGEPVQDLFVERFRSASSDEYVVNTGWRHARHRLERISVKDRPDEVLDVLVTRHGPVIERRGTRALALAWTILREGGEVQALRNLDTATNWAQFRAATSDVAGPVLNFAYADVAGNIGYQDVGRVPRRRNGDGTLPVEGQDDRFAWDGDMPLAELPHALNPPNGVIATANNTLAKSNLTEFADAPYRVHRIYELLLRRGIKTPERIGAVQADIHDYPRAELAAITGRELSTSSDVNLQRIAIQLLGWDGMANANSSIPTFLSAEDEALARQTLLPKLGKDLFDRYLADYHAITPLLRVLDGDRRLSTMGITRSTLLKEIPQAAIAATKVVAENPQRGFDSVQTWGKKNAAIYDHPLGSFWPLNAMLNIRPLAQPGNTFTVYAGRPKYGPSQRLVADVSNWDNSSMLVTLGESGHYSDTHYADQADAFVNVEWSKTPFSETAVARATKDTLVLKPKSK